MGNIPCGLSVTCITLRGSICSPLVFALDLDAIQLSACSIPAPYWVWLNLVSDESLLLLVS